MRGSPTLLAALLAAVSLPVTSSAAPPRCAHTDPRGDVVVAGRVPVDTPHVDLVGYDVTVGRREVVATLRTAEGGGDTGRWSLMVDAAGHTYYFSAARAAELTDDPRTPGDETRDVSYAAYVDDGPNLPATGGIGADGTVRVRVPLKAFGKSAPRGRLTDFWAWSYTWTAGRSVEQRDEARSTC